MLLGGGDDDDDGGGNVVNTANGSGVPTIDALGKSSAHTDNCNRMIWSFLLLPWLFFCFLFFAGLLCVLGPSPTTLDGATGFGTNNESLSRLAARMIAGVVIRSPSFCDCGPE